MMVEPLRIGMLTPLSTGPLLPLLDEVPADLPEGIGGPGPTDLIGALVRAGHHVDAVSLAPGIDRVVRARGDGLELALLPMRPRHRARDVYRPERAGMRAELRRMDVDVVHAHWSYEYALAAHHATVPHLVTVRDWAPLVVRYNPIPYWFVKLAMNAVVLARRPPLTTPSPSVRRRLGRIGLRHVRLIPNGLRVDELAVDEPRTGCTSPPVLLSVANEFSGRKNTSTLLTAFGAVRRRYADAQLWLVGTEHGPGEKAEVWASERELVRGVTFLGERSRPEVLTLMGQADLLVHPAREEPFGIVVIEAMSQALPVIGGHQAGGVPFILDDGGAGELVDVESATQIAAGILRLLGDEEQYQQRSAAGLARVRDRFDVDGIAEEYVRAYTELLAGEW